MKIPVAIFGFACIFWFVLLLYAIIKGDEYIYRDKRKQAMIMDAALLIIGLGCFYIVFN